MKDDIGSSYRRRLPHRAFLGLGSNLSDGEKNLKTSLSLLESADLRIRKTSSLYHTEPVGEASQSWFMNAVVEVETALSPEELLHLCQEIEEKMGRQRLIPQVPRVIDLDILMYDQLIMNTPELTIPHPRMHCRRFVLIPLLEIAPDAVHPRLKKRILELLEDMPDSSTVKRGKSKW